VRIEVLTDRPDDRFVPGAVLYREGDPRPLTIASAEAVADGPGWRVRFREITSRDGADTLRGAYLEANVRPEEDLARGTYYWHEVIGVTVRGIDGADLGKVQDIYRVAETEVFVVGGGPFGTFDLPAVRAFIRIFAPRRGEIVVDAESLDLRPPRSRTPDPDRPKAPRRRARAAAIGARESASPPSADADREIEALRGQPATTGAKAPNPGDEPAEPPA
jgi:16S rRNA processing protein RimM